MRRLCSCFVIVIAWSLSFAQGAAPVEFGQEQVRQHLISDQPVIHTTLTPAEQRTGGLFEGMEVNVVVGTDGNVISAKADDGPARLRPKAEELVRGLHFRPFEKGGITVSAAIKIGVPILPPEEHPARHVPFPRVKDWQSLRMRLSRTGCFGSCPAYSIEVRGDGTVVYEGGQFAAVEGHHHALISKDAVAALLNAFRGADYFSLRDSYSASVTDLPTFETSIQFDGHSKQVTDYAGDSIGMPDAVTRLESLLDHLTDSERWVSGNANTVASLVAEHWDFKSEAATTTLMYLAQQGKTEIVREMLAAGTPPNAERVHPGTEERPDSFHPRSSALVSAAAKGDVQMLTALLDAGAYVNEGESWSPALAAAARNAKFEAFRILLEHDAIADGHTLVEASGSGSAEMVKRVLGLHVDAGTKVEGGITALFICAGTEYPEHADEKRSNMEVARILLDAGADPNARTSDGETALMKTGEAAVAELLIEHGADVNAKDNEGETALLKTFSAEVTRVLLAHGANPMARDKSGKTALERAKQFNDKEMISAIDQALSGRAK
jgi:ankyrin repeat protein